MLGQHRHHDGWKLRSLALVDRRRVCRHDRVKLPERVLRLHPVEVRNQNAFRRVHGGDVPDVAIEDRLVVIVSDLHDFVSGGKAPPEPLDRAGSLRIEGQLQFGIERANACPPAVHRA